MQHENEEPRYGIFYYCEIKRYASKHMDGFNLAKVATWPGYSYLTAVLFLNYSVF